MAAQEYEETIDGKVRIDLNKGIMVDPEENIMSLSKVNGKVIITKNEDGAEKEVTTQKASQKVYTQPSLNTIYSNQKGVSYG